MQLYFTLLIKYSMEILEKERFLIINVNLKLKMVLQNIDLGAFFAVYFVFIIIVLAINVAVAVWVYRDAEKNGMDGAIWLIVVLVGGCVGIIVYLIISRDVF